MFQPVFSVPKIALKNARVTHFVVWEECCDQPSAAHKK